jgi:hypothetical protein
VLVGDPSPKFQVKSLALEVDVLSNVIEVPLQALTGPMPANAGGGQTTTLNWKSR